MLSACGGERLFLGGGGDSGCVPGQYVGEYSCDAGATLFGSGSGNGPIAITLEGDRGGKVLRIAPGVKLTSAPQGGFTVASDVSGTLDCTTNRFTGTFGNIVSTSPVATVTFNVTGQLSADYDASAPPALVNGVLEPPQVPDAGLGGAALGGSAASCTWYATLQ